MAYVTVPKDLTKVKSKVLFGMTKRQLICFTPAVASGVPLYFTAKSHLGNSTAALLMILAMLPFFLFAMYERNGEPLEVILKHLVQTKFLRPKERVYETENGYAALMRQAAMDKEVYKIVKKARERARRKADRGREKRARSHRKAGKR